jgi:hypothetical protein
MTSTMTSYTQPQHTDPLYECIICKDEYMGEGNSALPIIEGKCCANCYFNKVIDARLVKACLEELAKANDKSTKQPKMMTTNDIDTEIEALTQRLADLKAMKRNLEVEVEEEEEESDEEEEYEYGDYGVDNDTGEIMVAGGGMANGNAYATIKVDGYHITYREYGKNAMHSHYRNHVLEYNDEGTSFNVVKRGEDG